MPGETTKPGPPVWKSPFQCCRLQQGSDAMFQGAVSGSPMPSIKWFWKGKPLSSYTGAAGKGKNTSYDPDTGKVTLVIEDMGPGDEGVYECKACNDWGDTSCMLQVTPEAGQPQKQKLPKGSCRTKLKACHVDSDDYKDYACLSL